MADLTSQKLAKERASATSRQDSAEFGRASSGLGAYDKIMALQEAAGNRAVDQLLQTDNDGLSSIVEDLSRNRNGQPLDPATREFMERGFGVDFSNVRLHLDNSAADLARGLNARAFTNGNDIFFSSGSHPSTSVNGKAILAHELTHVLQQSTWPHAPGPSASSLEYEKEARQSSERIMDGDSSITSAGIAQNAILSAAPSGSIQRIGMDDAGYGVPRESRSSLPLEALGLPSEADVAKDDEQMDLYLGREMQAMLEVQENVSLTRTDNPLLEDQLRRLVRLTALGIMAAHRAALIGLRDRTLTSALRAQVAAQPDTVCDGAFATLRDAAWNVDQLEQLRSQLISNRHGLHIARTRVLQSHDDRGVVSGLIEEIFGYAQFDTTAERQREIRDSYQSIHYRYGGKQDWEFAWHLADDLIDRRGKQIAAVTLSLAKLYEAFPVLHVLGAKNVVGTQPEEINLAEDPGAFEASMYEAQKSVKGYETDQKLLPAVERAFSQILQQVDKVIRAIATDDIDPFDMPEAVRRTNENLTPTLEKALQKAVRTHQGKNIVASLGTDLAQALIALIPLVGPFIAFGIGAARMGSQLEDMFDRAILADVGANPYADSPLGVNSPATLEWVMLGVSAVLSAVDLGLAIKGVRTAYAGESEIGTPKPRNPEPPEMPSNAARTRKEGSALERMRARTREKVRSKQPDWHTRNNKPPSEPTAQAQPKAANEDIEVLGREQLKSTGTEDVKPGSAVERELPQQPTPLASSKQSAGKSKSAKTTSSKTQKKSGAEAIRETIEGEFYPDPRVRGHANERDACDRLGLTQLASNTKAVDACAPNVGTVKKGTDPKTGQVINILEDGHYYQMKSRETMRYDTPEKLEPTIVKALEDLEGFPPDGVYSRVKGEVPLLIRNPKKKTLIWIFDEAHVMDPKSGGDIATKEIMKWADKVAASKGIELKWYKRTMGGELIPGQ